MTTWTTISNAAVAVGAIPSSSTVTALRDNPVAVAESASGAPVVFAGWHPVDKVSVGDGKDGLIYSHAVTGAVASVVTPDFVDGYEYRIVARDLNSNAGVNVRLEVDGYFQTDGAYGRLAFGASSTPSNEFGFDVELSLPRIASVTHAPRALFYVNQNTDTTIDTTAYNTPAQKLLRARVAFDSGSISAGKIWLFRRREYASSP